NTASRPLLLLFRRQQPRVFQEAARQSGADLLRRVTRDGDHSASRRVRELAMTALALPPLSEACCAQASEQLGPSHGNDYNLTLGKGRPGSVYIVVDTSALPVRLRSMQSNGEALRSNLLRCRFSVPASCRWPHACAGD